MADKVKIKDPVPGATAEEIIPTETEGTPILPSAKKIYFERKVEL